jgi:nucleoid-associated protein YgaU
MKKLLLIVSAALLGSVAFAASYMNNTYQKLADEYTRKAQSAFNAGLYDQAVDYSQKAEENAALSKAYIEKMIARSDADRQMKIAQDKIDWATEIHADRNFPMAYSAGKTAMDNARNSYAAEDYKSASGFAGQVLAALEGVREITPLPQFYIVRPWADTKDCYWNISGRPYVYNNPLLWENLYQENKKAMPRPDDPNLILPGMKIKIPSLTGEFREGTYTSSKKYDAYDVKR